MAGFSISEFLISVVELVEAQADDIKASFVKSAGNIIALCVVSIIAVVGFIFLLLGLNLAFQTWSLFFNIRSGFFIVIYYLHGVFMENKKVRKKLNEVVAMLDGKSFIIDEKDTKLRVEMAKLKLLKSDPGLEISEELRLINKGRIALALVSFIDKKFIMPTLLSIFSKKAK